MNVLSLFDGMSCGRIALNGMSISKYFASEIDSHAIKISLKNYPNTKHLGDVTKITSENLPKIDLLFGGSPCQSFSRAGDNKGFEGKSGLFWEFVRILKEVKPTYFLLENVVMKKEWKDIISEALGVQPIEINSNLTSSQNRKRLYWTNIPNVKKPEDKKISLESILQKNITGKEFILSQENIDKNDSLSNVLTTILSDKYLDKGHIKRVDFVKFLEKKGINVDVFGGNRFLWKNYKGSLPYHNKDDSLLPYKYSFNCENHSIKNYCTEKLIDGILSETLTFYSGCYNVKDYIDEKAFVYLELSNFEKDYQTIKKAIEEDWWSQRLPYIKEAKKKILNELQFFPRLHKIINSV